MWMHAHACGSTAGPIIDQRAAKQPEFLRDVQNLRVAQPTFGGRVAQWLSVERRCDEGLSAVVRARAELPPTFGAPVGARWRPFGVGST
jgi:hypothetical protein